LDCFGNPILISLYNNLYSVTHQHLNIEI
jgi:hypothetical protein